MAKQLRLDVAQLTDVGRKRDHNEDNMAYVIPKDPQVMAGKGALFIVADGMGGHAAGEVASEAAVDTVTNLYYQDDSDEVATSLLHAIKHSNTLIHQRAAENMLRSGMGTTCITAVLLGNMAYIANVGDSRAYLIRNDQAKQVSQDHSWVAEQVRAGLLTEDQARTHAQRNVITRCLGTQADVDVDVFSEELHDGDSLVLCTDGLSGLISEDELQKIVSEFAPQESVYHLVERANEHGGSDNITAIVIRVQEVGAEVPAARPTVRVGGSGEHAVSEVDTVALESLSGSPLGIIPTIDGSNGIPSLPLHLSRSPVSSSDSMTAPQPPLMQATRKRRNRLFYPMLALLILLIVAAFGSGGYVLYQRNFAVNVDQVLHDARTLITQANTEASSNPTIALQHLAHAQSILQDLQSHALTSMQNREMSDLLQKDLTMAARSAIHNYDQQSFVTALPCSTTAIHTLNEGSTNTQARNIAAVQSKNMTSFYAMGTDHTLYQINNNSLIPIPHLLPDRSQVLSIASDGKQLFMLMSQPTSGTSPNSYTLGLLLPGDQSLKTTATLDNQPSQVPSLMTVSGPDVYVLLTSASTPNSIQILDFNVSNTKNFPSQQMTTSISTNIASMAAFPNHQLFLLLADGSLQSIQFGNQTPARVSLQQTLASPLAVGANGFTAQTPVPVPATTQGGRIPLALPGAVALVVASINKVSHLYILDASNHRVLDLIAASSSQASAKGGTGVSTPNADITLQLLQQFVSFQILSTIKDMTVDAAGNTAYILTQNEQSTPSFVSVTTNVQNGCA